MPRTLVLDLSALSGLDRLVERLSASRVVYVGEQHNRYADHLNQLAILRGLYDRHPDLALGVEFFQQPFQRYLDDYVAGRIPEKEMLRRTEYFSRWRYDYRFYRPILRFARAKGIPVLALNPPREWVDQVAEGGVASLSPAIRRRLPEMDASDPAYRERLRKVFAYHRGRRGAGKGADGFGHFLEAQLLWDEGMAARAAAWLRAHPGRHLLILAGSGHLEYRQGIPSRLQRRIRVRDAVVLNADSRDPDVGLADFLLYPEPERLPPRGLIGVRLDTERGVRVAGFTRDSAGREAGLEVGDLILEVAGEPVSGYPDVRLALLDHGPGDRVSVRVRRGDALTGSEERAFQVRLKAPPRRSRPH